MNSVDYALESGVATISMNDGRANVMNAEMLLALMAAFERAETDRAAVLLQSGLPTTYSAGFDLRVFASRDPTSALKMVKTGGELIDAMLSFPRPIVAVAKGHIFPMGLFTLLAADYRIGADADYLWGLNEVEMGIVPPLYAFKLLEARLTPNWFHRTLTSGDKFPPRDALDAGVFDEILPEAECEARGRAVAHRLAGHAADAFKGIKRRLKSGLAADVRAAVAAEQTLSHYEDLLRAGQEEIHSP